MKNWDWKNWTMFVGLIVLFVVCVVLITVGVLTHTEPGFSNEDARWDHMPLTVSCHGYVASADQACDAAMEAVNAVNSRLGFNVFDWSEESETDVSVIMRAALEVTQEEPGGSAQLDIRGAVYHRCTVRTVNANAQGDVEWLVVYHELGHCLGLAHDNYRQSIMYPIQSQTPDREIPPWISDFDRELLREVYRGY